MRSKNFHEMYKQKLMEKISEKKDRADKIKEQQQRIANICTMNNTVRSDQDRFNKGLLSSSHRRNQSIAF